MSSVRLRPPAHRSPRATGVALLCVIATQAACTRDGDEGYTALLRYAITDFRVAGISARLVEEPTGPAMFLPGAEVELRAELLQASTEAPELEWLDCPAFVYEGEPAAPASAVANVDCLGTPREIRLGRGQRIRYRIRAPSAPLPPIRDGGIVFDEAGMPIIPDGGWPEPDAAEPLVPEEREQIEIDDGLVFLRATLGDEVRYGRKSFLGLFTPDRVPWVVDELRVDGEQRALTETTALRRAPGARVKVRFQVAGVAENQPVQWLVTGGELSRHGLTYYVDVGSRTGAVDPIPTAVAENIWRLPDREGAHELVALVGGSFAELPLVRLRVEVQR